MEGAIFQPHPTAELNRCVYVAQDLEVSIEGNTQTINDGWLQLKKLEGLKKKSASLR